MGTGNYSPSVPSQVRYVIQWFQEWGEMQRKDFFPHFVAKLSDAGYVNGLSAEMENVSVENRPPSIFQCRIKLFKDWAEAWGAAEKEQLLNGIRDIDPEFVADYEKKKLVNDVEPEAEDAENVA